MITTCKVIPLANILPRQNIDQWDDLARNAQDPIVTYP